MKNKKITNPRKGKRPITLWATKEEIEGFMEVLGDENLEKRVGRFINKLNKRGDVEVR